jgi:hypothetical protein
MIQATLTTDQASAVCDGLDAYTRLCIGQLEEVASLVRHGVIPMAQPNNGGERVMASVEVCDQIEDLMMQAKALLGYPRNGSHGIGHRHNCLSGLRAYEVQKALSKVVAEQRNPNPEFRGVAYDGLGPRYTTDPAPTVVAV